MNADPSPPPDDPGPAPSGQTQQDRGRERAFNVPGVVLGFVAVCIGIHLVRWQALSPEQDFDLLLRTAFVPIRYVMAYDLDIWAVSATVTYSLLHGDWIHLGVNVVWLLAFGSPLAGRIGALGFVLFWFLSAVASAFVFLAFHPYGQDPLIGASGSISGMMGAAARFGFQIDRRAQPARFSGEPLGFSAVFRSRAVITFLAIWMAINWASGILGGAPGYEGQIAWEAHLGGLVAGFLSLPLFVRKRREA